jgi:hypothetical protein
MTVSASSGPDLVELSEREFDLLCYLTSASHIQRGWAGTVRWALDAGEVCDLLELGAELAAEWGTTNMHERASEVLSLIARCEPPLAGLG